MRVYIELGSVIGDNVIIGLDVDIKCFIVWNGVLVGEDVNLWVCVICWGFRIDCCV